MSRLDHIQITDKKSSSTAEPVYSTLSLTRKLEDLGFLVFPLMESKFIWNPLDHQMILEGYRQLIEKKPEIKNSLLWLDLEGTMLDFQCREDEDGLKLHILISNIFKQFEVNSKQAMFKNHQKCIRFCISIKTTFVG
jgi:hypothetical protein